MDWARYSLKFSTFNFARILLFALKIWYKNDQADCIKVSLLSNCCDLTLTHDISLKKTCLLADMHSSQCATEI